MGIPVPTSPLSLSLAHTLAHETFTMPTFSTITIPGTPSANYVLVENIAPQSNEKTVKEFFLFCGKIEEFELTKDDDGEHQAALIHFERESAAKTATLLSNALIDDSHIVATPYFADHASNEAEAASGAQENNEQQESKPKSRIAAEILANGYVLHDHIVAKGLEYDTKYGLSSRLQGYLSTLQNNVKQFDEKYRIWDKIVETDQKYKIHEKVQNATQTALQTPTAQKARDIANHTLAQIAAVHYEATKIKQEKATHAESDAAAPATTA